MKLAVTESFIKMSFHVSPKISFNPKGFPMSKVKSFYTKIGVVVTGAAVMASNASAALTAPTLDTADFTTVAGVVLLALGSMWGIKKAIGLIRV